MKKHFIIRISLLLLGFLLIFIYTNWDSCFNPQQSIGGNSGMSIPENLVYNIGWMMIWCFLLFLEIMISFFSAKNTSNRIWNAWLIFGGIVSLVIYVLFFFK